MAIVFYQKDATVYAVHYKESENPLDVSKNGYLVGLRKFKAIHWKAFSWDLVGK